MSWGVLYGFSQFFWGLIGVWGFLRCFRVDYQVFNELYWGLMGSDDGDLVLKPEIFTVFLGLGHPGWGLHGLGLCALGFGFRLFRCFVCGVDDFWLLGLFLGLRVWG